MTTQEWMALVGGLIGGLALFLYGMNIMSGGLTRMSGGKLELILSKVTSNKLMAWIFGIGVTALVQSSSASTVMVVGLVNSGIMKLTQAVNVILGANLGTTFTAWLLSLNAISSDNLILSLFKPATFTPYLALAGIVLYMFTESERKKNVGTILLGFSVLMFGMQMMSGAVAPLKDSQSFISFLTRFKNPLIGFAVGLIFTMVVQSSAATIGVLQALSLSVGLDYGMAIPVVIGSEVGTCITAILSSLGAGTNGKRAACMHLSFNVIKAASFMVIFYALNAVFHFSFLESAAGMAGIAAVHTLVNLVASPLMLPFSGILVRLAGRLIPDRMEDLPMDKEQEEWRPSMALYLPRLEPRFLNTPSFAIRQAYLTAVEMAQLTQRAVDHAISLIGNYDEARAKEVEEIEDQTDLYEDRIGSYLIRLTGTEMTQEDNARMTILQHCITDLERIADHAMNIRQTAEEMRDNERVFTDKTKRELDLFTSAVREIVQMTMDVFCNEDTSLAKQVEPLEDVIDDMHDVLRRNDMRRLRENQYSVGTGFDLNDIGANYERIADHCSNIAICVMEAVDAAFDPHTYLKHMDKTEESAYDHAVRHYREKYTVSLNG